MNLFRIVYLTSLMLGLCLLNAKSICLLNLFSSHSFIKPLGTLTIADSSSHVRSVVPLNHVIKFSFEIDSSISDNTAFHSSSGFIGVIFGLFGSVFLVYVKLTYMKSLYVDNLCTNKYFGQSNRMFK